MAQDHESRIRSLSTSAQDTGVPCLNALVQATEAHISGEELAEKLQEYCRDHLTGYKVPRSVDFEDALPRHLTVKLYKRPLRNRYRKGRDRKI